ncbi:MAG: type II toxin-antitoxin system RelE/ParE family toxin [Candidatus Dadabacteria bacterium]|nr:MAG: type II toxin-antitoxin system RelE/ParE family toxin [Candidatus Dadabacteria bacterium]
MRNFKDKSSEELAQGLDNKRTRKALPKELHKSALKKLQILRAAKDLGDLKNFPGLKLEKLKGNRNDQHSIRINDQYRICFRWEEGDAYDVSIEDYH